MNPISIEHRDGSEDKESRPVAGGSAPRPGRLFVVLVSSTGGALLALLAVTGLFLWFTNQDRQAALPVIGPAPQYQLVNQNGKPVSSGDFSGKVQIVTPLFPYCRELCPLVAANLAEFHDNVVQQSSLKGRVEFVFFNVAPADAGPKEMREFLKQYGWNSEDPSVQFLTGSPDEIKHVVEQGYHIAYYRTKGDTDEGSTIQIANALADRVKPDFDVKHADTIEVVDGSGRIRKIFSDGTRLDDMRLQSAIAPLLSDASTTEKQKSD
ncbi:MAG: SCO family protein [Alphaproteobacteria bacterium]|nr:SCO family protein [Alphaproteobacteria bacterium]